MQVTTRPMRRARLAGPGAPRAIVPLLLAALLALAPALAAQSAPTRWAAPADARLAPPPAFRPAPGDSVPPFANVVAGAVSGGVIGGLAVGAVGFLLGLGLDGEPYVPLHHVTAGIGAMAGFPIGAALGARRAATLATGRPPVDGVMTASILSAVLGGLLWNGIGQAFDSSPDGDYTPWYLGAATGISTHLVITSVAAHRAARRLAAGGRR